MFNDAGLIVIVTLISPDEESNAPNMVIDTRTVNLDNHWNRCCGCWREAVP